MIIPWQDISPDALDNLIESFVLREGTDYGEHERSLEQKSPTSNANYNQVKPCWCGPNCMKRSTLCRGSRFTSNP